MILSVTFLSITVLLPPPATDTSYSPDCAADTSTLTVPANPPPSAGPSIRADTARITMSSESGRFGKPSTAVHDVTFAGTSACRTALTSHFVFHSALRVM